MSPEPDLTQTEEPALKVGGASSAHMLNAHMLNAHMLNAHMLNAHMLNAHMLNAHMLNANMLNAHMLNAHMLNAHMLNGHILQGIPLSPDELEAALDGLESERGPEAREGALAVMEAMDDPSFRSTLGYLVSICQPPPADVTDPEDPGVVVMLDSSGNVYIMTGDAGMCPSLKLEGLDDHGQVVASGALLALTNHQGVQMHVEVLKEGFAERTDKSAAVFIAADASFTGNLFEDFQTLTDLRLAAFPALDNEDPKYSVDPLLPRFCPEGSARNEVGSAVDPETDECLVVVPGHMGVSGFPPQLDLACGAEIEPMCDNHVATTENESGMEGGWISGSCATEPVCTETGQRLNECGTEDGGLCSLLDLGGTDPHAFGTSAPITAYRPALNCQHAEHETGLALLDPGCSLAAWRVVHELADDGYGDYSYCARREYSWDGACAKAAVEHGNEFRIPEHLATKISPNGTPLRGHGLCEVGEPLPKNGSLCTDRVCEGENSHCCTATGKWSATCVELLGMACGIGCNAVTGFHVPDDPDDDIVIQFEDELPDLTPDLTEDCHVVTADLTTVPVSWSRADKRTLVGSPGKLGFPVSAPLEVWCREADVAFVVGGTAKVGASGDDVTDRIGKTDVDLGLPDPGPITDPTSSK